MAFKEAEVVKRLQLDSKLNNSPVIMGGREREQKGLPLMQVLGKTIAEFSQLPKGRQPDDFPDNIAYFKSEDTLVMLRRRRPIIHSPIYQPREGVHDGYFAEVFDMGKDGKPINGFSSPASLDGLFQGIEITDELDDPFDGSYLTPTVFSRTIRERLGEKMRNQPKALPSLGDENKGALGQLFGNIQFEEAEKKQRHTDDRSIRKEIIDKYYNGQTTQGLTDEVGNSHIVITEDKNSQIVRVSKELGVETYAVGLDQTWGMGGVDSVGRLTDSKGKRPMLISVDGPSFGTARIQRSDLKPELFLYPTDTAIAKVGLYVKENPLFSFIEWTDTGGSGVSKIQDGWYLLRGNEPETTKKLIMKVGIDYLLTSKVRELAKALS